MGPILAYYRQIKSECNLVARVNCPFGAYRIGGSRKTNAAQASHLSRIYWRCPASIGSFHGLPIVQRRHLRPNPHPQGILDPDATPRHNRLSGSDAHRFAKSASSTVMTLEEDPQRRS